MQTGSGMWMEAAQRLWAATYGELSAAIADEALPRAVREAANLTVRTKGEFMVPDAPGTDVGSIATLATELAAIPGLTPQELSSIKIAPKQAGFEAPPRQSTFTAPPIQRKRKRPGVLRIVLLVTALLLVLEALARAGAPVPSVGGIVDRLRPDPEPEVDVTPTAQGLDDKLDATLRSFATTGRATFVPSERKTVALSSSAGGSKHPNHANGRLRDRATGKELNRAEGKDNKGREDVLARATSKVRGYANGIGRSSNNASRDNKKIKTNASWGRNRKR